MTMGMSRKAKHRANQCLGTEAGAKKCSVSKKDQFSKIPRPNPTRHAQAQTAIPEQETSRLGALTGTKYLGDGVCIIDSDRDRNAAWTG